MTIKSTAFPTTITVALMTTTWASAVHKCSKDPRPHELPHAHKYYTVSTFTYVGRANWPLLDAGVLTTVPVRDRGRYIHVCLQKSEQCASTWFQGESQLLNPLGPPYGNRLMDA